MKTNFTNLYDILIDIRNELQKLRTDIKEIKVEHEEFKKVINKQKSLQKIDIWRKIIKKFSDVSGKNFEISDEKLMHSVYLVVVREPLLIMPISNNQVQSFINEYFSIILNKERRLFVFDEEGNKREISIKSIDYDIF